MASGLGKCWIENYEWGWMRGDRQISAKCQKERSLLTLRGKGGNLRFAVDRDSALRLALVCRAVACGRREESLAVGGRFEEFRLGEFQTFGKRSAEVQMREENNGEGASPKACRLGKSAGIVRSIRPPNSQKRTRKLLPMPMAYCQSQATSC